MCNQRLEDLKNYIPYIKKTIELAEEWREEFIYASEHGKSNTRNIGYSPKQMKIFDYLNSLEYEKIKVIQTIMYVGRESGYNYDEMRETLTWEKDKEIEVHQIVEKTPLAKYLIAGCEKIGLLI